VVRDKAQDNARLRWLFLDLNSYFASVEQQENPRLRGRPVIVTPVESETTCAIAASYEAKIFGVRTGTMVREARRMCPELLVVNARHDVYVDYHHRIVDEIERHLHVTKAYSIDEVACELLGAERRTESALALAQQVQRGILDRVGICLRSSVGLGPSVLLAKTASDMKKPGGLTVLGADTLPEKLLTLRLGDLSGIGRSMSRRLEAAGVKDIAALWALSPSRARAIWGSIEGERFWYALHGTDPPAIATKRQSIGHSHVLAPALRNPTVAYRVARSLLMRAASRLRRVHYVAGGLSVFIRVADRPGRDAAQRLCATADTFRFLETLDLLWRDIVPPGDRLKILHVGVTLYALSPADTVQPDLFGWAPGQNENPRHLRLSVAIDRLNERYKHQIVSIGTAPAGLSAYTGAKIAFNRIPEREDFVDRRKFAAV
jgi:DNA polymerase-4